VVQPDDEALAAFGTDLLDPAVRSPAAVAGRTQGRRVAGKIAALWN
jgi:NTE family protein